MHNNNNAYTTLILNNNTNQHLFIHLHVILIISAMCLACLYLIAPTRQKANASYSHDTQLSHIAFHNRQGNRYCENESYK